MKISNNLICLLAFLLSFMPCCLLGEPIQADRPGFSTGTYTVKPKTYYMELGFQSDYNNNNPDSFTAPLLNFRTGINPTTELNILIEGWTRETYNNNSTTSTSDILLGAKHRLTKTDTYNASLLGYFSLPTIDLSNLDDLTYFLGFLWNYNLNPKISAFGTLQFTSVVEENNRNYNIQVALGFNFSHTSKLSSYVEYYRDNSINLKIRNTNTINIGVAYLLTKKIQLDTYIGVSNDNNTSKFIGTGLAIQF